jgi:hypothetical protein
MTERTTVRLPDDLLRRAKRKAAQDGSSLTALIKEGLRRMLDEKSARVKRVMPPVSRERGGLMPGISLDDTAALVETDDLEYAKRFFR